MTIRHSYPPYSYQTDLILPLNLFSTVFESQKITLQRLPHFFPDLRLLPEEQRYTTPSVRVRLIQLNTADKGRFLDELPT